MNLKVSRTVVNAAWLALCMFVFSVGWNLVCLTLTRSQ